MQSGNVTVVIFVLQERMSRFDSYVEEHQAYMSFYRETTEQMHRMRERLERSSNELKDKPAVFENLDQIKVGTFKLLAWH